MKFQNIIVVSTLLILGLTSCSKDEITPDPVTNPTPSATDSNYLSKIFYLDSAASVQDTFARYTIFYDNAKRVQYIIDSTNTNSGMPYSTKITFYYQGTDSLPVKSVNEYYEYKYRDTATTFYTYNATGKKIKDSAIHTYSDIRVTPASYQKNVIKTIYQYNGNRIFSVFTDSILYSSYGSSFTQLRYDSANVDVNGNIISSKYNYIGTPAVASSFTYDTHPNPFYKLNIFNASFAIPEFLSGFSFYSPNNVVNSQETRTNPASVKQATNTYMYYPSGYPKQQVYLDVFSSSTNYIKAVYKYKAL